MKKMKNSMKCLMALLVMAMTFVVAGVTAQAANPTVLSDANNVPEPAVYTYNFAVGQTEIVDTMPIPSKGTVLMYAQANTDVTVEVYNGAVAAGYSMYLSSDGTIDDQSYDFPAATTATIKFTRSSYQAETEGTVAFSMYFVNSADTSVSANQTTTYYSQNYDDYTYTKIKVKNSGYIEVQTQNASYVTLCNSKKKAISDDLYVSSSSPVNYFAVKKGTYYIKTKAYSDELYTVKYKFKKVKEKSGSSKSKAVTIGKNKTAKGLLTANNKSQTDWYKIRLTKKQYINFSFKSFNTGSDIKIQVIPANSRMIIYNDTVTLSSTTSTQKAKSRDKFEAGTYYLKVTKKDNKASGYYQIKWK